MRHCTIAALIVAGLSGSSSVLAAGDKLALGVFGNGKGRGALLTRAELRECLTLVERIKSGNETALSEREQIDQERKDLVRAGAELKSQLETLDRSNEEAVKQYVERAAEHDHRIDALEARTGAFNAKVEALGSDRAGFTQRCDNRRFDTLDEAAIRAGK